MDIPAATTPVACDMSTARDTPPQRLAEYRRLFAQALRGRERTAHGIRFRLAAEPGIEAWVRDLAAREQACCPFFAFEVAVEGDEVRWDAAVADNDVARAVLDEFSALPDTATEDPEALRDRLSARGLEFGSEPSSGC